MNNNLLSKEQVNAWLAERRKGIGGSEISAVLGHSEWKSPLDVYYDKLGESPPIEANHKMKTGHRLENFVAKWYSDLTGIELRDPEKLIIWSKKSPIQFASIDKINDDTVFELKTTQMQIEDPLPSWYEQATWGADVAEKKKFVIVWATLPFCFDYEAFLRHTEEDGDFTILRSVLKIDWREYDFDELFARQMLEKAEDFWYKNVVPKVPPEPSNSDDILKYIESTNRVFKGDENFYNEYEQLAKLKKTQETIEEKIDELSEIIKLKMLDAESASYCGKTLVTWKTHSRSQFAKTSMLKEYPKLASIVKKYTSKNQIRSFLIK